MPDRSSACRIVIACFLVAALSACSGSPFPVAAPKSLTRDLEAEWAAAQAANKPPPRIVSICYSNLLNSSEEVLDEARYECGNGEVTYKDTDRLWTPCGLLQPMRASFICRPNPPPAE